MNSVDYNIMRNSKAWRPSTKHNILALLIALISTIAHAQTDQQLVRVTYTATEEEKLLPRLQVVSNHGVEIKSFGLAQLPKSFRSIRVTSPKGKVNRNTMETLAEASFNEAYQTTNDTILRKPTPLLFDKQKQLFLNGRNASPYIKNEWTTLAQVKGTASADFSFRVKQFLKKSLVYKTDELPAAFAYRFPAIDPWVCDDASLRMFSLRKLQGYGLPRMKSSRYVVTERETRRRNFEIYFRRNETIPDQAGVNEVISYLKSNDYVIVRAEVMGGASVEGDAVRNKELQKARGEVIQKLFKEYNDNPVREDTLLLLDHFAPFREQIRHSPYEWLDTLVNESLQQRINEDVSLMKNLEPYLKTQRKATLRLIMTKKNSTEEQLTQVEDAMTRMMRTLMQNKFADGEMQYRLLGAVEYLMDMYKREQVTEARMDELFMKSPHSDLLYVLAGYYYLKQFEIFEQRKQAALWKSYWDKLHVKSWIAKGQQSAIALADQSIDRALRMKYVSMCVDFQAYTYRFASLGLFEWSELCEVPYTGNPIFTGLRLNQYALLYELSQQEKITCFPIKKKQAPRDSSLNSDAQLEQIKKEIGVRSSFLMNEQLLLQPTFDTSVKSAYYELLKSYYVKGDKQVMEWVQFADGGKPELNVFNLYHIASISVASFDPFKNFYYDAEVRLNDMDKLITQLKRVDQAICKPQINQLYLDYHLKALYYLQHYFVPGSEQQARIAEQSLLFITDYYKKHAITMNSSLTKHIVWQLNAFNELPSSKPGAWYGYGVLDAVANKRQLQGEELKLYAHYTKMYNPDQKPALPKLYDTQVIDQLAHERFAQIKISR